jgi:hypothetical protein
VPYCTAPHDVWTDDRLDEIPGDPTGSRQGRGGLLSPEEDHMSPMTERDMRAVALGMAVGATVGAAVALLLAPKRGAELRGDLTRSAANVGRKVGSAMKRAGTRRVDDSADLRARSGDMVAEGGPAEGER